ncbi:centrosomal protein of 63 kDa isoform X5 [Camelus ferus]|uniref:Centrosomal protein of 63 kDa n=1 Tax=Camelus ferus TaxID=419612 RepID=A0A8B8TP64_CAMFR|nr:centrosomal protein of 63 kDa isoform X5 [Camelus ferus]
MARGGLPLPPAGLQARPRRLGSAPAPRPSALPRMSCGPAQPDLTSLGAPSGPASCQNKGDLAMEALLEGIQNRGRDGGFLTSCEAELQELMKQIDIMVAHKKSEWEGQTHALETCLDIREQELKALRSQLDMKHKEAQLANRKQKLESVELSSQSEIQHLSSKLERANDTICANELEIERLTMRVNDLVGTNMAVMQEQRQKEERLRESEKLLEVLQEEKRELKAALQTQENFIHEARIQKEKLQAKLKATDSQHTVETIRSLEESQAERRYASQGQGDLENVLSRLDFTHASEELLQAEVTRLEGSLESVSATCKQLSQELMEKYEELKKMEVHNNEYRAEIKKLKEQILQAEQSYSSVLEGMKMEISQLTRELHQRDITIASTKSSSSDMEKRLKAEIQKAEEKDVEHKEILGQLESLKLENRHLSEMVMKLELGLHECPLALSPLGSIATRFLEEEELRSHHILERLDAHIEELKRESEKTVKQFTALK